jgi:hypothetical protein
VGSLVSGSARPAAAWPRSDPERPRTLVVRDITASYYERRRPERTLLHRLVSEHLDTFLATFREAHDKPLPRYVEKELRAFLDCGDLSCTRGTPERGELGKRGSDFVNGGR